MDVGADAEVCTVADADAAVDADAEVDAEAAPAAAGDMGDRECWRDDLSRPVNKPVAGSSAVSGDSHPPARPQLPLSARPSRNARGESAAGKTAGGTRSWRCPSLGRAGAFPFPAGEVVMEEEVEEVHESVASCSRSSRCSAVAVWSERGSDRAASALVESASSVATAS